MATQRTTVTGIHNFHLEPGNYWSVGLSYDHGPAINSRGWPESQAVDERYGLKATVEIRVGCRSLNVTRQIWTNSRSMCGLAITQNIEAVFDRA